MDTSIFSDRQVLLSQGLQWDGGGGTADRFWAQVGAQRTPFSLHNSAIAAALLSGPSSELVTGPT